MNNAVTAAAAAAELPIRDPRYDATFDGATNSWRAGAISAGVGGVAVLAGAWLLLKSGSSGRFAEGLQLLPTVGRGERGMALLLPF